jgi:DUF1680 family protein
MKIIIYYLRQTLRNLWGLSLFIPCAVGFAALTDSSPVGTVRDAFASAEKAHIAGGLLGDRMRVNVEDRLLKLDLDSILQPFEHRPGSQDWVGEHAGKWLDAATCVWRTCGDARLKAKMDYVVGKLVAAQESDGYLGTYLDKKRWTSWDVWSHKYVLIGLLAYYQATHDFRSLEASRKIGDLLVGTFGEGKRDIIKSGTHVGLAPTSVLEPMVDLYKATGDKRYLDFCNYIVRSWEQPNGPHLMSRLLAGEGVTKVGDAKAYEMMSDLVGLLKLYQVTGDSSQLQAAINAWHDIREHQLYVTGTASWAEEFQTPDHLQLGGAMQGDKFVAAGEGCVTVTWIQLNKALLQITGKPVYADQLERSIYNALLAAQCPLNGTVSYFTPLLGRKRYGEVNHGILPDICCCSSSIPRGIAMIPGLAAGTIQDAPALLLYAPGEFTMNAKALNRPLKVTLAVETDFPVSGKVIVAVGVPAPSEFPLLLRVPSWCHQFTAHIGTNQFAGQPGTLLRITRTWHSGDRIDVELDLPVFTVPLGEGKESWRAVQRGPQVLAADNAVTDHRLPEGWYGQQLYCLPAIENGLKTQLALVPISDAGQRKEDYGAAFEKLEMPLGDAKHALANYHAHLAAFRAEYGGMDDLPNVRFFLFGMGQRAKFIYRDGRLLNALSGKVVRQWRINSDVIVPPDYAVTLDLGKDGIVVIREDEEAVWLQQNGKREVLEGTHAPVKLPRFTGHPYANVLRVLHQEMLINVTPSRKTRSHILTYDI